MPLAPGGVLIYETFAQGNESVGKPSNPAFLLEPGELLDAVRGRACGWSLIRTVFSRSRARPTSSGSAPFWRRSASADRTATGGTPALLRVGWLIRYNRGLPIKFIAFHD